jgi:hypothetical protein
MTYILTLMAIWAFTAMLAIALFAAGAKRERNQRGWHDAKK